MYRTRAERRHWEQRAKEKTKRFVRRWSKDFTEEDVADIANHMYQHRKKCSCWMCVNERKQNGRPTIQELRQQHNDEAWEQGEEIT